MTLFDAPLGLCEAVTQENGLAAAMLRSFALSETERTLREDAETDSLRTHDTQDNNALVKSELGKARLVVYAPLEGVTSAGLPIWSI